jgi:hypothetical protein
MVLGFEGGIFIGFVLIGVVSTVVSERVNAHLLKLWAYN